MSTFKIRFTVGGGVLPYVATLSGTTNSIMEDIFEDGTYEFDNIPDGTYLFNVGDSFSGVFSEILVVGTGGYGYGYDYQTDNLITDTLPIGFNLILGD